MAVMALAVMVLFSCNEKKAEKADVHEDTLAVQVTDTAVYGKCGEGTSMHSLELITDDGKTMEFLIDEEMGSEVQGGLFAGDKMSVVYCKTEDGNLAQKVVNMTTLLGRWTSLDRNFTILEGGQVESMAQAESRPYTSWSAVNGNIVLNTDTFAILSLGADSLALENNNGVFVYKRQEK